MTKNKVGLVKCCSILNAAEFFNSLGYEQTLHTGTRSARDPKETVREVHMIALES